MTTRRSMCSWFIWNKIKRWNMKQELMCWVRWSHRLLHWTAANSVHRNTLLQYRQKLISIRWQQAILHYFDQLPSDKEARVTLLVKMLSPKKIYWQSGDMLTCVVVVMCLLRTIKKEGTISTDFWWKIRVVLEECLRQRCVSEVSLPYGNEQFRLNVKEGGYVYDNE